jgi:Peptidase M15
MKRILTVTLGIALASFATAATAAPNHIPSSSEQPIFSTDGDSSDSYSRPRSSRRAATRSSRRRANTRSRGRHATQRSGRRSATRRGGDRSLANRSFTRYASPGTSRGCLTSSAQALLGRIEAQFGRVQIVSTCRPGARIAGTGRISRHASGNAIDFNAPSGRKAAIVRWLIANHRSGGVMTYAGMSHIHADIGPRFVSLNSGGRSYRYR